MWVLSNIVVDNYKEWCMIRASLTPHMNKLSLPLLLLATQPAESELKKLPENSIVVAEKILFSEVVLKLLAANEGRLEDGDYTH